MRKVKVTVRKKTGKTSEFKDTRIVVKVPAVESKAGAVFGASGNTVQLETEEDEVKESTEPSSEEQSSSDASDLSCNEEIIKARLPYYGKVINKEGEKIGKVRRNVYRDLDKEKIGKFVRQDSAVYLIDDDERKGYLDKNYNIFDITDGSYVATIKRNRLWLILLIILLTVALVSSLFAAFYTPKSENYIPVLFIADEDGTSWDDEHNLPVFFNKKFGDTIIEPGLSGRYAFMLENRNADEIIFDLTFSCENEYGIKLVYRLKRDGAYVAGYDGYVPPEQLNLQKLTQQARSTSVFELEWTWQHDDSVDTVAGESGAMYKLHIHFLAEVNYKE